jgi:hypothetical protein
VAVPRKDGTFDTRWPCAATAAAAVRATEAAEARVWEALTSRRTRLSLVPAEPVDADALAAETLAAQTSLPADQM